jgi:hypothetical protein
MHARVPDRRWWVACRPLISEIKPIASGLSRLKENSVVLWRTRTGPTVATNRAEVAANCPARV